MLMPPAGQEPITATTHTLMNMVAHNTLSSPMYAGLQARATLLHFVPLPVFLLDCAGVVIFVNDAGFDYLQSIRNFLPEDFNTGVGVRYADFHKNSDHISRLISTLVRADDSQLREKGNSEYSALSNTNKVEPQREDLDIGSEILKASFYPVRAQLDHAMNGESLTAKAGGKVEGLMVVWQNNTREKNQERWDKMVLEQLDGSTANLADAIAGLQKAYSGIAGASRETSETAEEVLHAVHEVGTRIRGIAANIEENSAAIASIADNIRQTSLVAANATSEVQSVEVVIDRLNGLMGNVNDMVANIQRVMKQTRMLAINAGIEAARAGASGMGFGVIASEIGRLSEQTAKVTNEITSLTREMLIQIPRSAEGMQRVRVGIDEVNAMASAVNTAIQQQESSMVDMSSLMNGAAQSTQTMLLGMASVTQLSQATERTIEEGKQSVAEVEDTKDTFSVITQRFGQYLVITPDDSFRLIMMMIAMTQTLAKHLLGSDRNASVSEVSMQAFTDKKPSDVFAKTTETIMLFLRTMQMPTTTIDIPKGAVTPTQVYAVLTEFLDVVEYTLIARSIMHPKLKRAKPVIGKKPDDVFAAMDMLQRLVKLLPEQR
jgi:methyl-accepting chemotaxis protein